MNQIILPTILTILGVAILCALGTWQLQRLEWKTDLLATLEEEYNKDARQYPIKAGQLQNEDLHYKRGVFAGAFNHNKEFLLRPRTHEGEPGYHSYVPFSTPEGITILVNRGYVPLNWPGIEQPRFVPPIALTGMLRRPGKPNFFTPKNNAEKDEWYWIDLEAMAKAKDIKNIAPYILNEEGPNIANTYPIRQQVGINLNNNHLQYAFFWFAMAGALIVVYVLRFLRKP